MPDLSAIAVFAAAALALLVSLGVAAAVSGGRSE
jgi:hypothetical protein